MSRTQLEAVLRTVPFVSTLGIAVEEARPGDVVLRLPLSDGNQAHGGTLHSGALFSVAELAAAVAVGTHPKLAAVRSLQKATRIEYVASARVDVTAHAKVTPELLAAITTGIERDGKAIAEIPVQVVDGHGHDVANVVSVFTFKR